MCQSIDPIQCIIPPHMQEKIVENGSKEMRTAALQAIQQAAHHRDQRSLIQEQPRQDLYSLNAGVEAFSLQKHRRIYDAKHSENLPGTLILSEGENPSGLDTETQEAYAGAGTTWDLYYEAFGRNSIDDNGMIMDQTIHYGEKYNNAFWNGRQMVYGDGDNELFDRFTIDIDIIGHELTHGVVQFEGGLVYKFQSGALNESFADVFGSMVKQWSLQQDVTKADWLIGQNILIGKEYALRSMKAPGTAYRNHPVLGSDPQPATMDDYLNLKAWQDHGGVHLNSGIPNHAFYLATMDIGGHAWKKTGRIWYRTLRDKLTRNATFQRAAEGSIEVAGQLFGAGSKEEKAVTKAWRTVKVI